MTSETECPFDHKRPPRPAFLSNLSDSITSFEAMADPYPFFKQMRDTAPVVEIVSKQGLSYYHVTGWDEAVAILRDARFTKDHRRLLEVTDSKGSAASAGFVISGAAPGNLLNNDPPEHTRLRALVNLAFSPHRVSAQEPIITQLVNERLAALEGKASADIVADFAYPIAIATICRILGVPPAEQGNFCIWAAAASNPGLEVKNGMDQAEGSRLLMAYLTDLIARKCKNIRAGGTFDEGDLLSAMATAQLDETALSAEELRSMAYLLLLAGHETTVGLISASLLRLAQHPDQLAWLVANPDKTEQAVEEFLRYDGSVMRTTFRAATTDVDVGGYIIPKGGITVVVIPSANRDPARFDDPERFDVRRKPRPHLAFGNGVHFCLGSNLAKMETRLAVGGFIRRFPRYTLSCAPDEVEWPGTVIRAPRVLPVNLQGA